MISAESRAVEALIAHVGTVEDILASRALSYPEGSQEYDQWQYWATQVQLMAGDLNNIHTSIVAVEP